MCAERSHLNITIQQIIEKPYENRSKDNHQLLRSIIMHALPEVTEDEAKTMSLFIELIDENAKFTTNSILLQKNDEEGQFSRIPIYNKEDINALNFNHTTLYLSEIALEKCKPIKNIEEEIYFLRSLSYFQEIPKKRLYHVLRNADILSYSFGQCLYREGDQLEEGKASVYLVKQGQFCFAKQIKPHQTIILYEFGQGYIFGNEDQSTELNCQRKREFTIHCRSSLGIVLRFTQDFFYSFLKKACQYTLKVNQQNISKFLEDRMKKIQINRDQSLEKQQSLIKRSYSLEGSFFTMPSLSKKKININSKQSLNFKKTQTQISILPSVSSKSKLQKQSKSIRTSELSKQYNPEYQQEVQMLAKKYKCQRLRTLINTKPVPSRGQILLNLVKNAWNNRKVQVKHIS